MPGTHYLDFNIENNRNILIPALSIESVLLYLGYDIELSELRIRSMFIILILFHIPHKSITFQLYICATLKQISGFHLSFMDMLPSFESGMSFHCFNQHIIAYHVFIFCCRFLWRGLSWRVAWNGWYLSFHLAYLQYLQPI